MKSAVVVVWDVSMAAAIVMAMEPPLDAIFLTKFFESIVGAMAASLMPLLVALMFAGAFLSTHDAPRPFLSGALVGVNFVFVLVLVLTLFGDYLRGPDSLTRCMKIAGSLGAVVIGLSGV